MSIDPIDDSDREDPEAALRELCGRQIREMSAQLNDYIQASPNPIRALTLMRGYAMEIGEFAGEVFAGAPDGNYRRGRGLLPHGGGEEMRQMVGALIPAQEAQQLTSLLKAVNVAQDPLVRAKLQAQIDTMLGIERTPPLPPASEPVTAVVIELLMNGATFKFDNRTANAFGSTDEDVWAVDKPPKVDGYVSVHLKSPPFATRHIPHGTYVLPCGN